MLEEKAGEEKRKNDRAKQIQEAYKVTTKPNKPVETIKQNHAKGLKKVERPEEE